MWGHGQSTIAERLRLYPQFNSHSSRHCFSLLVALIKHQLFSHSWFMLHQPMSSLKKEDRKRGLNIIKYTLTSGKFKCMFCVTVCVCVCVCVCYSVCVVPSTAVGPKRILSRSIPLPAHLSSYDMTSHPRPDRFTDTYTVQTVISTSPQQPGGWQLTKLTRKLTRRQGVAQCSNKLIRLHHRRLIVLFFSQLPAYVRCSFAIQTKAAFI